LGLLSAGVAHEINNPLAYVANNLAVLERDWCGLSGVLEAYAEAQPALAAACPELAGRIDRIGEEIDLPYLRANLGRLLNSTRQGVKRISGIVESLRGFARLDQAAVDRVDLQQAIAGSLELIRGELARHHITVEQQEGGVLPVVCAPAQINQVVLNLLVNAMQAIKSTGRGAGRIEIETRSRGDEVVLEVADDGCGIPAAILPRIFDPFFTTKPVGQGTGLGLAISHGIVADHGGRIEVESTPGRGSRFRVILPVVGKGQGRGSAGGSSPPAESRGAGDQHPATEPPRQ
jgi:signal transduction histidine kinase